MDNNTTDSSSSGSDSGSNSGIIIGIVIFLLLFLFFVIVIIAIARSDTSSNNAAVTTQVGGFLSACTTVPCEGEFVCDGVSFVCKEGTGAPCNDSTDCANGLFCSGICVSGATGGLNQYCPCLTNQIDNQNYLCTAVAGGLFACKGAPGTSCTGNNQCASGFCAAAPGPVGPVYTCGSGFPPAFPCQTDNQCDQLTRPPAVCSLGFCQIPPAITGQIGASCGGNCVTFSDGAVCGLDLTCTCFGDPGVSSGICTSTSQGIYSPCSFANGCGQDLNCYTPSGSICGTGNTGCFCAFPYNDPNAMALGSVCIGGMTVKDDQCYNNDNLGCSSSAACFNDFCGGNSVLAAYVFGIPEDVGTRLLGATDTEIIPVISGPNAGSPISPYKMFAFSSVSAQEDIIYLVDHDQGLWSLVYNPIQRKVVNPWFQLLPLTTTISTGSGNSRVTTTQTLIDAAFNGNPGGNAPIWIVAYQETITSITGTVSNNVLYTSPDLIVLTPYNVTTGTGLPGTQYTTSGTALTIQYIDISQPNDISAGGDVLISTAGTIYVKAASATTYNVGVIVGGPRNGQLMTGTTGPARFYYDNEENPLGTGPPSCPGGGTSPIQCSSFNNIAFVANFGLLPNILVNVLQFSGNIAGFLVPTDRIGTVQYQVFDFAVPFTTGGMPNTAIITLSNAYSGTTFIDTVVSATTGVSVILPYRVDTTARSCSSELAYYVISIASCSNP